MNNNKDDVHQIKYNNKDVHTVHQIKYNVMSQCHYTAMQRLYLDIK
jgi:hypothetical protein